MTDNTPTTQDVLTAALAGGIYSEAEFDRWLASVKAQALRDAAATEAEHLYDGGDYRFPVRAVPTERLAARAVRIERGESR